MVLTAPKSGSDSGFAVKPAAMHDILEVLARHNPGLSKTALKATGKVMAAISAATAQLTTEQQRKIVSHEDKLAEALGAVVADIASRDGPPLTVLKVERPVEVSQGAGLNNLLDMDEGRRRLTAYATPVRIEDWAGPVAGPAEIEKTFGTKRSTLHDWQKRGAVIGLLKGERKHVFPLAQFVDGRPVRGMSDVTRIIGNPRAAWQWLIQPKPSIGGTPLDQLKAGKIDEVITAAGRDFG
ncbi:hypothetical protein CN233_35605 [Sinorhizobium meliloti]|uniref:antitoxin Xre/MbcA/ParS-like domain-containing protein n=1 Tax=Rhizobium meliloti TaxID=382 RepID=UPI000FD8C75E|nr:hypothetical protein [Sinorhizobium meliloti]RVG20023.1 hypothetical protein CN233_35605 [Sinorhizobium meliloti]RVK85119.1 hypothetical protein CN152_35415 [Sinorhizobium meliloti]RVN33972.1 hypothetical protein CN113_35500 [Sinorhizobium meliloti]